MMGLQYSMFQCWELGTKEVTHDVVRVILAPRVVVRGGRSEQVCYYGNGIRGRIQLWGWGIYSPLSVQYYGDYRYCIPLHHIGEVC